jgi:hypothetical protein
VSGEEQAESIPTLAGISRFHGPTASNPTTQGLLATSRRFMPLWRITGFR